MSNNKEKLNEAYDLLFDNIDLFSDPEHQINCHADTLPEVYRRLAEMTKKIFEIVEQNEVNDIISKL